jgi:hypothetical protein
MAVLDESFVMMASITSSRYVGGVRGEVNKLENSLKLFSNTLDEWLECQKNWMYLESIFSAPDIQRQLPKESKDFFVVRQLLFARLAPADSPSLRVACARPRPLICVLFFFLHRRAEAPAL